MTNELYVLYAMKDAFSTKKLILAAVLITLGVAGRLIMDTPNFETITTATLLAGLLLGGVWTFAVGLLAVGISDVVLGNEIILLYTWSAWAAMGLLGWALRKTERKPVRNALQLTGAGVIGQTVFYLWTNLGVWHVGQMYPHTWHGLMNSYIAGIPFFKNSLVSTLVFVPVLSVITIAAWNYLPARIEARKRAARHTTTTSSVESV